MNDSTPTAKHLTVEECRKILGEKHKDRTDEEIEQLLQWSRGMARLIVKLHLQEARAKRLAEREDAELSEEKRGKGCPSDEPGGTGEAG